MNYTIKNDQISAVISDLGAELLSIKAADGTEFLWQRDPAYWADSSPILFPFVGRLVDKTYYMDAQAHTMEIHGFAKDSVFEAEKHSDSEILFRLKSNKDTLRQYPRHFVFSLTYSLKGNKLNITYQAENTDEKELHFGVGAHPGFRVPLKEGLAFEDYYVEFDSSELKEIVFTPDCFVEGTVKPYPLRKGHLDLTHSMFDNDAIVLKGSHRAILRSDKDSKSVIVDYPDMPYLGLWHKVKSNAPYVCIEPWLSLPARKEGNTIFEKEPDLIHLAPNNTYINTYSITIMN